MPFRLPVVRVSAILAVLAVIAATAFTAAPAGAQEEHNAATIERDSRQALALLRKNSIPADKLADDAAGILVFPKILKGGLIIGGQYGEGALFQNDAVKQYYSTAAASFGLQAGLTISTSIPCWCRPMPATMAGCAPWKGATKCPRRWTRR